MAYIQQRGERKYKITVCNGYKPNGQKRMQARTVDVPKEVPKRSIQQYVMAEAERLEKRFRTGIDQSENTRFEDYANRWLERMAKRYKTSTLEGYRRMLEAMYPTIGGLPLCKIRPMVLEELCEELRQRPGRNGKTMSENTVHKYLDTVSAVLQDAVKNDILLYNPAHRVDKLRVECTPQRIPQAWEMQKLLQCILQEPLLYRVYYLLALSTGLRRGELCALRWRDLHGGNQLLIQHSRSTVVGKGVVESDTKSHRTRVVVLPQLVYDYLGELLFNQIVENNGICPDDLIFAKNGNPIHPDTFSRHLRKMYDRNGFPKDYHLHTMRHFFATYLLENGTSKQVTADLLGHADTAFLERTYCHPQDACKEQAAGLLDSNAAARGYDGLGAGATVADGEARTPVSNTYHNIQDKSNRAALLIRGFPVALSVKMTVMTLMTLMTLILIYPHAKGYPNGIVITVIIVTEKTVLLVLVGVWINIPPKSVGFGDGFIHLIVVV